jgi:hypothetical protein
MSEKARMRGRTKVVARCHVEGHGQRCELGREIREKSIERATEKRSWLTDARYAVLVHDWDA